MSVLLLATFIGAMLFIYRMEVGLDNTDESDDELEANNYENESLSKSFLIYFLTAAVVVGAAIWLAIVGDHLSDAMGWEKSFMGTQFLALSTSLPELAASFAALRLGAPDLAITNVLGSNLFNMGFVLFMDDVVLTTGALWLEVSAVHMLTGVIAIVMTALVVMGILSRRTGPKRFPISFYGGAMIALYIAVSVLVFYLS